MNNHNSCARSKNVKGGETGEMWSLKYAGFCGSSIKLKIAGWTSKDDAHMYGMLKTAANLKKNMILVWFTP